MARIATEVSQYEKKLVRLPPDLVAEIEEEATQQERSFNGQLVYLLRTWLRKKRQSNCAADCPS